MAFMDGGAPKSQRALDREELASKLWLAAMALGPKPNFENPKLRQARHEWLQKTLERELSSSANQFARQLRSHHFFHFNEQDFWYPSRNKRKRGSTQGNASNSNRSNWVDPEFDDPTEDMEHAKMFSAAWSFTGALCGLALENIIQSLGESGICSDYVRFKCNQSSDDSSDDINCRANIAGIISNLFFAASYITALPSYCNRSDFDHSQCLADAMWFTADAAEIAMDGISLQDTCNQSGNWTEEQQERLLKMQDMYLKTKMKHKTKKKPQLRHGMGVLPSLPVRGLGTPDIIPDPASKRDRERNIADCYFNAENMVGTVVATVLDIWVTVLACNKKRHNVVYSAEQQRVCAADAVGSVSDILALVNLAASIADLCPVQNPRYAGCVGDTSDMASSIVGLGAWAASIYDDCKDEDGIGWHSMLLTPFAGR
eukprot:CAMPEP_0197680878 /NCGR_PEP_ID=MMETSP1338-20131121/93996_1 /TAXON_ID=43686 ORGANISM="Pelagodinium beii, Strain RCC1491" /NCGR_SAMPLE_ID=MMETSP1338 /ASSEMBLY_ACC=CAM_ASM_000754 /LENGTH=428 /DNA_ID=CAMNT_0043262117 /DNA_START=57 /DNA_END=1343 /DNA_ORIENTATION=-